ncbi:MAG: hypothetical protein IT209_12355 [Armatimonadetes bacterium]|nr:hypothetical protein [Armatimonadota bacterium]
MSAGSAVVDSLPGHAGPLQAVRRMALENRLPHSLLVTGPDGAGNTAFALKLAAELTCLDLNEQGACGVCRSCVLARAGTHSDILRIAPPKEETTIGQIRELRYVATLAPNISPRRVIIIERGETLNDQAANAILKVLEDTPDRLTLMILAPSAQSVLPTIESRAIEIPLRSVDKSSLTQFLMERGEKQEQASAVAAYAGGSPGRALSLLENPQSLELLADVAQWVARVEAAAPAAALKLAEDLKELSDRAKKIIPSEDGVSDRQAVAWVLDAVMAVLQEGLAGGTQRWSPRQTASITREINLSRHLILSYAAADLQLERLLIHMLMDAS